MTARRPAEAIARFCLPARCPVAKTRVSAEPRPRNPTRLPRTGLRDTCQPRPAECAPKDAPEGRCRLASRFPWVPERTREVTTPGDRSVSSSEVVCTRPRRLQSRDRSLTNTLSHSRVGKRHAVPLLRRRLTAPESACRTAFAPPPKRKLRRPGACRPRGPSQARCKQRARLCCGTSLLPPPRPPRGTGFGQETPRMCPRSKSRTWRPSTRAPMGGRSVTEPAPRRRSDPCGPETNREEWCEWHPRPAVLQPKLRSRRVMRGLGGSLFDPRQPLPARGVNTTCDPSRGVRRS